MISDVSQEGLRALATRYDALLCDIWGVVHNGIVAHPEAVEALQNYRAQGGRVILITNAARPHATILEMLKKLNVPDDICDGIVTSGDVTRDLLKPYLGQTVHHVGPHTDLPMFEGLDLIRGPEKGAQTVVITGLANSFDTPDDYADRLATWRDLGLPLICANPDKFVEVGEEIQYCPGALADIYEEMGGEVHMAGKPYAPIYDSALSILEKVRGEETPTSRVLAVGDSVRTDATGAANMGVDLLFVTGSIHAKDIKASGAPVTETVQKLVAPSGANMQAFMPRLYW